MTAKPNSTYPTITPDGALGSKTWWGKMPLTTWLVVGTGFLALLANLAVFRAVDQRATVLVAAHDLPAGHQLQPTDLSEVEVSANPEVLDNWIPASSSPTLIGQVLPRPLTAGEVIRRNEIVSPAAPAGKLAMSIPVSPTQAAGGAITIGDRVDVISTEDAEVEKVSRFVAVGLPVLAVPEADGGGLGVATEFHVVVAVSRLQALGVAEAIAGGEISILVSTVADRVPS